MTDEDILVTEKSGNLLKINLIIKKLEKLTHNLNILEDGQGGLLEVLFKIMKYSFLIQKIEVMENQVLLWLKHQ